jgi:hypothetical protein
MRLAISEQGADGMPTCDPFKKEKGLQEYAHIDAHGTMKTNSYASTGIHIGQDSVMDAIFKLRKQHETLNENLE